MKKSGKLNLNRETLRDLEREAFGLHAVLGGSMDTSITHPAVSNTVTTVGSGSCYRV